jgi:ubiquinone/menaquinone biosynthesis C-methylase UbiE
LEKPILSSDEVASFEQQTRRKYSGETSVDYTADSISRQPKDSHDYFDQLLRIRLGLAQDLAKGRRVLDVGCATGVHLLGLAPMIRQGVGIDFSGPLIRRALEEKEKAGAERIDFVEGNARQLPFLSGSFNVVYSFSSLYYMPNVEEVIAEIARVLSPGGHCLIEFGNSRSLNSVVTDAYPELARSFHITVRRMKEILRECGLEIFLHKPCQILPYWGERPDRIKFFLKPSWKRWFEKRVGSETIDERVSAWPVLRNYAFRHFFLCSKPLRA